MPGQPICSGSLKRESPTESKNNEVMAVAPPVQKSGIHATEELQEAVPCDEQAKGSKVDSGVPSLKQSAGAEANPSNVKDASGRDDTAFLELKTDELDVVATVADDGTASVNATECEVAGAPSSPACQLASPSMPSVIVAGPPAITNAVSAVPFDMPSVEAPGPAPKYDVTKTKTALTELQHTARTVPQKTFVPEVLQTSVSVVKDAAAVTHPAIELSELEAETTETAVLVLDRIPPLTESAAAVVETGTETVHAALTAVHVVVDRRPSTHIGPGQLKAAASAAGSGTLATTEASIFTDLKGAANSGMIQVATPSVLSSQPSSEGPSSRASEMMDIMFDSTQDSTDCLLTNGGPNMMSASASSSQSKLELDVSKLDLPSFTMLSTSLDRRGIQGPLCEMPPSTEVSMVSARHISESCTDASMVSTEQFPDAAVDDVSLALVGPSLPVQGASEKESTLELEHTKVEHSSAPSCSMEVLQAEALPTEHTDNGRFHRSQLLSAVPQVTMQPPSNDLAVKEPALARPLAQGSTEVASHSQVVLGRCTSVVQGAGVHAAVELSSVHSNTFLSKKASKCSSVEGSVPESSSKAEGTCSVLNKAQHLDVCSVTKQARNATPLVSRSDLLQQPCAENVTAAAVLQPDAGSVIAGVVGVSEKCLTMETNTPQCQADTVLSSQISGESPADIPSAVDSIWSSAGPRPRLGKVAARKCSRDRKEKAPTIIPVKSKVEGLCDPRIMRYSQRATRVVSDLPLLCWSPQEQKGVQPETHKKENAQAKKKFRKKPLVIPLEQTDDGGQRDPRLDFYGARKLLPVCPDRESGRGLDVQVDLKDAEDQIAVEDRDNSQHKDQKGTTCQQEDDDHEGVRREYNSPEMSICSNLSSPRGGDECREETNSSSMPIPSLSAPSHPVPGPPPPLMWNTIPPVPPGCPVMPQHATSTCPWPNFPVSRMAPCYNGLPYPAPPFSMRSPFQPLPAPIMPVGYQQSPFISTQSTFLPTSMVPYGTSLSPNNVAVLDVPTRIPTPPMPPPLPTTPLEQPPLPPADLLPHTSPSPASVTSPRTPDETPGLTVAVNDLLSILHEQSQPQNSNCRLPDIRKLLEELLSIPESTAAPQVNKVLDLVETEEQLSSDQTDKLLSVVTSILDLAKPMENNASPSDTTSSHETGGLMPQELLGRHRQHSSASLATSPDLDDCHHIPLPSTSVATSPGTSQILLESIPLPDAQPSGEGSGTTASSVSDYYVTISSDTDDATEEDNSSFSRCGKKRQYKHSTHSSASPRSSPERKVKRYLIRPESQRQERDLGPGWSDLGSRSSVSSNRSFCLKSRASSYGKSSARAKRDLHQELHTRKTVKSRLATPVDEHGVQINHKSHRPYRSTERKHTKSRLGAACHRSLAEPRQRSESTTARKELQINGFQRRAMKDRDSCGSPVKARKKSGLFDIR